MISPSRGSKKMRRPGLRREWGAVGGDRDWDCVESGGRLAEIETGAERVRSTVFRADIRTRRTMRERQATLVPRVVTGVGTPVNSWQRGWMWPVARAQINARASNDARRAASGSISAMRYPPGIVRTPLRLQIIYRTPETRPNDRR